MKIYTYNQLEVEFTNYSKLGSYILTSNDTFRIIRLMYDEKKSYLFAFCNTKVENELLQFYFIIKMDLFSYKECYNTHVFPTCRNRCTSYTTFVAPGLPGPNVNKINVIKYKRNEASSFDNSKCLDKFLHNVNRAHMQTPFIEGKYMRFKRNQRCERNFVSMSDRMFTLDCFEEDFEFVDEMKLTTNIMPVVSCYDIETHSDGHNMSKASVDFVISIAFVIFKDNCYTKFCFVYYKDSIENTNLINNTSEEDIYTILFNDEIEMIDAFLNMIKITNPDVILDFNGDVFDLPFLIERLKRGKFLLKRYDLPAVPPVTKLFINKLGNKVDTHYFDYYIHVDLYKYFSTDSNQNKVENFQLNTISNYFLNENKIDLHWTEMLRLYARGELEMIVNYNVQDCMLPIKLFHKLKIADSIYSQCILHRLCTDDVICNISHLISVAFFYKSLTNTRINSDDGSNYSHPYFFNKNDLSIISGQHKSFDKNRLGISQLNRKRVSLKNIPNNAINLGPANQIVKYKGGKVLQPHAGIYKYAFSLDFNSLYLTIMIAICACLSNLVLCEDGNVYLNQDKEAINVKLLLELLQQRSGFKKNRDNQTESQFLYDLYDQMQNSVKRTANSIYGYYGIFYKPLANHITKVGRDKLRAAITLIENMSNDPELLKEFNLSHITFKVVYGDTDSTFVLPSFNYDEIPEHERVQKLQLMCNRVAVRVNASFSDGFKMAFENLMCTLILLKKKKYCYLNSENKIIYKGWLVKKDMPVFMRTTFKLAMEQILRDKDLTTCLQTLLEKFNEYYEGFAKSKPMTDYSFSMTYNDNPGKKRKHDDEEAEDDSQPKRRRVITIAKHCREILVNKGADFIPGNGDRIPYLLIDVEGKITEKAYPLRLFNIATMRISWMKHMGILCTFMNELLEIFGDEKKEEIAECFKMISKKYMHNQLYDVKEPVLVKIAASGSRKRKRDEEDSDISSDEDDEDKNYVSNTNFKFCLYKVRK
ncbi:DNA polymerase [Parapoynx stagnalis nucleopolyhedrovirus]|uniref:DNA polymerase n=1 Tax=Parapoynx stagnalis nucleopolyhedrovirus TaxID=2993413 RepID=A0A9E7Y5T9_9ABAC|nr:DNA polymerase [Parapoynx stagnalis nucleopolyhedrovirus]